MRSVRIFATTAFAIGLGGLCPLNPALAADTAAEQVTFPNLPQQVVQAARGDWFGSNGQKNGTMSKLSFNLALVHEELNHYLGSSSGATPQNFVPRTGGVMVQGGNVAFDAIASGSGVQLLSDLQALGLQGGRQVGLAVGGMLPISALPQAAQLASLRSGHAAFNTANLISQGTVVSQGDTAQGSNTVRTDYGVDGSGVGVGVFSNSFNCLGGQATDDANGDLPGNPNEDFFDIDAMGGACNGDDEGRAMAQIVHDVAPGADIHFASAFISETVFANGILALPSFFGDKVLVDDVSYFDEPMFQDGLTAQAVDKVEGILGTTYFSSAGNSARQSWSGLWRPATVQPDQFPGIAALFGGDSMQAFGSGNQQTPLLPIDLPAGQSLTLSLQWDQPDHDQSACVFTGSGTCPGPTTDLDIYLLDDHFIPVAGSFDGNIGNQPVEIMNFSNNLTGVTQKDTRFYIAIVKYAGPDPHFLKFIEFDGATYIPSTYDTLSSTLFGHANASGAIAVGAARYDRTPAFGVNPPRLELFSSAGGTPIHFDAYGNPIPEQIRAKPEISAPDGGDIANTFLGQFGFPYESNSFPNFFGTSAAAPHAAGMAALMLQYDSALTPDQIRQLMMGTADDIVCRGRIFVYQLAQEGCAPLATGFDYDSGAGLIDGPRIFQALAAGAPYPPVPTPNSNPPPSLKPPAPLYIIDHGGPQPIGAGTTEGSVGGSSVTTTSKGGALDWLTLSGLLLAGLAGWRRRRS